MFSQLTSLLCLSVLAATAFASYAEPSANGHRIVRRHHQIARGLAAPAASQDLKIVQRGSPITKASKKKRCAAKAKSVAPAVNVSSTASISDDTTAPTPAKVTANIDNDDAGNDSDPKPKAKPAPTKPKVSTQNTGAGRTTKSSGGQFDSSVNHPGGDATFYAPGLGACGKTNGDNDLIAAMAFGMFDTFAVDGNPNHNKVCGRKVLATIPGLSSVTVTIMDRCAGCMMENSLDFSPHAFDVLTNNGQAVGRFRERLQWRFIDE